MNVLIVHQNLALPDQPGGTRHFELGKALVANGHRVIVIASQLDYTTGRRIGGCSGWFSRRSLDGVDIVHCWAYPSLHRGYVWRTFSMLTFMVTALLASFRVGKVDVVVGTTPPIFQLPSAWLAALFRWKPFVLEIRDLWPDFAVAMGVLKSRFLIAAARFVEGFFYRRASAFIVNSPAYRNYLLERGFSDRRIHVIPNGVDTRQFDPADRGERFRTAWGADDKFVVLYSGAMGPANDLETFVEAADLTKGNTNILYVLAGDGKDRQKLEHYANKLALDNLCFVGTFTKHRMPEVLAAADLCVAVLKDLPEFRTVYPNKVFDYMAAGRPTLLAIDGVIREVVEKSRAGAYVSPGNPAELAQAIESLAGKPDAIAQMGHAARAYVVANFDRGQHADKLESVLLSVVSRG